MALKLLFELFWYIASGFPEGDTISNLIARLSLFPTYPIPHCNRSDDPRKSQ